MWEKKTLSILLLVASYQRKKTKGETMSESSRPIWTIWWTESERETQKERNHHVSLELDPSYRPYVEQLAGVISGGRLLSWECPSRTATTSLDVMTTKFLLLLLNGRANIVVRRAEKTERKIRRNNSAHHILLRGRWVWAIFYSIIMMDCWSESLLGANS